MAKKKPYRGPPPSFRRRPDPDAGWNAPPVDRPGALARAERILKQLEAADKAVWRKAMDFFSDVQEKVTRIQDGLLQGDPCSPQTEQALKNWEAGIAKWIRPKAGDAAEPEPGGEDPPAEEPLDEFA